MEKMGVDARTSPEPAFVGRPEPKIGIRTGMSIEPTEIGMVEPTIRVGAERTEPGRCSPTASDFG